MPVEMPLILRSGAIITLLPLSYYAFAIFCHTPLLTLSLQMLSSFILLILLILRRYAIAAVTSLLFRQFFSSLRSFAATPALRWLILRLRCHFAIAIAC